MKAQLLSITGDLTTFPSLEETTNKLLSLLDCADVSLSKSLFKWFQKTIADHYFLTSRFEFANDSVLC